MKENLKFIVCGCMRVEMEDYFGLLIVQSFLFFSFLYVFFCRAQ